jgi:hypothetical protein
MAERPDNETGGGLEPAPSSSPRGYRWAPFGAGNDAAVRHGAYSEAAIAPLVDEFMAGVLETAASDEQFKHLAKPIFRPAIKAWARCEARVERVTAFLERHADTDPGDLDFEGEIRPAATLLNRLNQEALRHRNDLAVAPASFARLRRDAGSALVSVDLAELLAAVGDRDTGPSAGHNDGGDDVEA